MRAAFFILSLFVFFTVLAGFSEVNAQGLRAAELLPSLLATEAGTATASPEAATPAAQLETPTPPEKDLTQTTPQSKSRLARLLDENPVGPLSVTNFLQHILRNAAASNVPLNILVLLLLFPVVASFIAASRHIIGLEGFGLYTPAVLAVTFLSTGLVAGILLFIAIISAAYIGREIFGYLKLQYLPRTALMLWAVSLIVFGLLVAAPYLQPLGLNLFTLTIFPILVLILLSENFIEALMSGTQKRALELTFETILLAALSAIFIRTGFVQEFVLLHPEITIATVFIINLLVGKYTGLRVSEYLRFKPIIDSEE